ncbi:malonyl-CoA decarboxylase [Indioceanicola profundi]|uniref:malonyl-CoA decarboxylase n=1 Tax=Indioceanicola profundi TaxID=2220096 RepID=UPI001CEC44AA|nr:malonyl-CoA decarboxylase [Indioceanicola profundi]
MSEFWTSGLIDLSLQRLTSLWRDVSDRSGGGQSLKLRGPDLEGGDMEVVRRHMHTCLEGRGGEVSARARAAVLGQSYLRLSPVGRTRFLSLLASEFGPNHEEVLASSAALAAAGTDASAVHAAERRLRKALNAPRVRLLTQLNSLPEGVKFLVDLRRDLLGVMDKDPALKALDDDLRHLLTAWFDVGFLEMRTITWDSPASLLEKLVAYEAVHAVRSWSDLKNRLDSDRRIYAFFHPRMPTEPLIFVQVAFTQGLAGNVQNLLDETAPVLDPAKADTAIFYSISNTQDGLRGISFGNFLIKRVVEDLTSTVPHIRTFSTLSPIPGFRRWLGQAGAKTLDRVLGNEADEDAVSAADILEALDRPDWFLDEEQAERLRRPLLQLCAHYLLKAGDDKRQPDPVARFHLGNGARVERLNWLGDTSPKGLTQSAGLMVNYLYDLREIEDNHERFAEGTVVAASGVTSLLDRRSSGRLRRRLGLRQGRKSQPEAAEPVRPALPAPAKDQAEAAEPESDAPSTPARNSAAPADAE